MFPWVISNYSTSKLEVKEVSNIRNLTKPIGALNDEKLSCLKERFDEWNDPVIAKFLYGTHYSGAGPVLHYMIRNEPFSSLNVSL